MCSMKRHSTSSPCGNLVHVLPHNCHTETMAKPTRLWPGENDNLMDFFRELAMFCIMLEEKSSRISWLEYIEGLDTCQNIDKAMPAPDP